jgi:hypothetical protein
MFTTASTSTEIDWIASWQASAALQAEFVSAASYAAFMKYETRRPGFSKPDFKSSSSNAPVLADCDEARWAAEWRARSDLQADYLNAESYVSVKRREPRKPAANA